MPWSDVVISTLLGGTAAQSTRRTVIHLPMQVGRCSPTRGDNSIEASLPSSLIFLPVSPIARSRCLLPSPVCPSLLEFSQSADFIECDKWQFIKKWEQMGNGLWKKINDAHRPLNRARFGSKHNHSAPSEWVILLCQIRFR